MRKFVFGLMVLFVFSAASCSKQESTTPFEKTFSEIKGVIVHDSAGMESSITGEVILRDRDLPYTIIELGTINEGKLDLIFPDIPPGEENRFFTDVASFLPGMQVTPQDASWLLVDDSKILVAFTDEEVPDIWDPRVTRKQNYILEFVEQSEDSAVWFAFFNKDTTIKGITNIFIYTYDVDIDAARGWNMIDVRHLESGVIIRTIDANPSNIKWTTAGTID